MKTACVILAIGEKYRKLARPAVNSFKRFHPDVDLYLIDDDNFKDYRTSELMNTVGFGLAKYIYALEIMTIKGYDKIICLGSDTITCSRLDEFLDDNVNDVICTLDYNTQFIYRDTLLEDFSLPNEYQGKYIFPKSKYVIHSPLVTIDLATHVAGFTWKDVASLSEEDHNKTFEEFKQNNKSPIDHAYLNADVICFNSVDALKDLYQFYVSIRKSSDSKLNNFINYYSEQGLLNMFVWGQKFINDPKNSNASCIKILKNVIKDRRYKVTVPEIPYPLSGASYNVRAKCGPKGIHPGPNKNRLEYWSKTIKNFYVKDGKLFYYNPNGIEKQIKVWHYCEGLGNMKDDEFEESLNMWNHECFNDETRKFFIEQCDAGDWFKTEFKV
jgi:hypothetical protein